MLGACAAAGGGSKEPVVETTQGRIRGVRSGGAYAFKGVPYAESTAGANRFRPPVARRPWAGELDATRGGASAPQVKAGAPIEFAWYWSDIAQSEDCLSLNVFTPALRDNKRRPILVWLHGGAFAAGAGTSPGFDGSYLAARQDVVVVSINHRLNVLGSLFTGEHADQLSPESGNVGTLDQLAALKWIKANAEAFGGDPDNITIFGQSGGAAKVTALLGLPAARGYIQRAVVQSGSGAWRLATSENAARAAHALLAEFGLSAANAGRLRDVPVEQLIAAFGKVTAARGGVSEFRPTLDGVVYTQDPFDPVASPLAADIPVLIGNAAQEATFFLASDPRNFTLSAQQVRARVQRFIRLSDADTKRLIDAYRGQLGNATPSEILIAIATDYNYRLPTLAVADRKAAQNAAPVYAYQFEWKSPARDGVLASPHTGEVPFIFGTLDAARPLILQSPDQVRVREHLGGIWADFARTGKPGDAVADWKPYSATAGRTTAILGKDWKTVADPAGHARQAFAGLPLYEYSYPVSFVRD
ncbi:carboxylesterase/lipase family protein [Bordetella sp. LUAb4]|uniref:carboxylesterase/lipase family protein n=1 Tax=Bordetella sp. LUAb4 TaxID=2843195 RepID=UPI001E3C3732|nr:carboxylesterase family protein [Bordetella sp. LUAb4]